MTDNTLIEKCQDAWLHHKAATPLERMEAALRQVLCEMQAYSERPAGLEAERQFVDSFANSNNITLREPMSDLIDKIAFSMWRSDQQHPERVTEDAFVSDPFRGDWRAQAEVAAVTVLEEMHDSEEAQHEYVSPTEFVKNFAKSNNLKLGEDK